MFQPANDPWSQQRPDDRADLFTADLARKVFAAATMVVVFGSVFVALRRPFGDGHRGEYVIMSVAGLIALGKFAFEAVRWHLRWRRLRRAAPPR